MVKKCYDVKYNFELLDPAEAKKIKGSDIKRIRQMDYDADREKVKFVN